MGAKMQTWISRND